MSLMSFLAGTLGVGLAAAGGLALAADGTRLSLPVACEPGKSCFVQNFVDRDPGPGVRDYACGAATYDGHTGVDIRLLSAEAARKGVDVLAAADGTVLRVRDGMSDRLATAADKARLGDRLCGNGLVVDHGGGLETQYCHLLAGSVSAKPGDRVKRGAAVGKVGYSGLAQFAHLHLTVRRGGTIVDPFTGGGVTGVAGACRAEPGVPDGTMWQAETARALAAKPGEVIQIGLAGAPPDRHRLEDDHAAFTPAGVDAPALVVFARLINVPAGDTLRFTMSGPGGFAFVHTGKPVDRHKATFTGFGGKRRTADAWPKGRYLGQVEVLRGGRVVATARTTFDMR